MFLKGFCVILVVVCYIEAFAAEPEDLVKNVEKRHARRGGSYDVDRVNNDINQGVNQSIPVSVTQKQKNNCGGKRCRTKIIDRSSDSDSDSDSDSSDSDEHHRRRHHRDSDSDSDSDSSSGSDDRSDKRHHHRRNHHRRNPHRRHHRSGRKHFGKRH